MSKKEVFEKYKELEDVSIQNEDGRRGIKSFVLRTNPLSLRLTNGILNYYESYAIRYNQDDIKGKKPIDLKAHFKNKNLPLSVEIGFGNGESFVKTAEKHKDINYFGFEVYLTGFAECLTSIGDLKLENATLMRADAKEVLLNSVMDESVDAFNIFFPDPWPKKKHHKRRLMSADFIALLTEKLKVGGSIHFATDIEDYAEETLINLSGNKALQNKFESFAPRAYNRESTAFERKGVLKGNKIFDLFFIKK